MRRAAALTTATPNEAIKLIRALWSDERSFAGRYWSYREVTADPLPSPPPCLALVDFHLSLAVHGRVQRDHHPDRTACMSAHLGAEEFQDQI